MSIPSVTSASWSGGGGTTQTNQRPAANLNASLDICMAKYEEYTTPIDGISAQYISTYTFWIPNKINVQRVIYNNTFMREELVFWLLPTYLYPFATSGKTIYTVLFLPGYE